MTLYTTKMSGAPKDNGGVAEEAMRSGSGAFSRILEQQRAPSSVRKLEP